MAHIEANKLPVDTHIEVFFEFSRWMAALGAKIAEAPTVFCNRLEDAADASACATAIAPRGVEPYRAAHALDGRKDVILAVKTTQMFHRDRLDVIRQTWGKDAPIDVLMNNAGIARPTGSWENPDAWRAMIEVNLFGVLNGVQAFLPRMIAAARPAAVVLVGLVTVLVGTDSREKTAALALTPALARPCRLRRRQSGTACTRGSWISFGTRAQSTVAPHSPPRRLRSQSSSACWPTSSR